MMRNAFEGIAHLGLPAPTGVLQVGASSGQEVALFRNHGIDHAVFIEALEVPFRALMQRISTIPNYIGVNVLCGLRDGEVVDFHVATNFGESSSLLPPTRHLSDYPWVKFPQTVQLTSFTLDTVLRSIEAQHPTIAASLDLLFMDLQGAELEVLKGGTRALQQARYLYTEVGLGGGYQGDAPLIELMHFLKAFGFDIYELEVNAEGWGNALFIKRKPGRV